MNKIILILMLFCVIGCEKPSKSGFVGPPMVEIKDASGENKQLTVTNLGSNDFGYWRLIELKYKGIKYVYLQHYYHDSQSMILVRSEEE